jgi:hypothetical protein
MTASSSILQALTPESPPHPLLYGQSDNLARLARSSGKNGLHDETQHGLSGSKSRWKVADNPKLGRRHQEFLKFMRHIDREFPAGKPCMW